MFLGVIVDSLGIVIGSLLGHFIGKFMKKEMVALVMQALALFTFVLAFQMAMEGSNGVLMLASIAFGAMIGSALKIHDRLQSLSSKLERHFEGSSLARGFISASLFFCIGSMTILGALESGVQGTHTILFTKAMMDVIASMILTASLGLGVLFSSLSILVYTGLITLFASPLKHVFSDVLISDISAVGGIVLFAIAINILFEDKIKSADLIPALLIPVIYHLLLI